MTLTVEEKSMWVRKRSQYFQKMQTAPPLTPKIGGMTGGVQGHGGGRRWQVLNQRDRLRVQEETLGITKILLQVILFVPHESPREARMA